MIIFSYSSILSYTIHLNLIIIVVALTDKTKNTNKAMYYIYIYKRLKCCMHKLILTYSIKFKEKSIFIQYFV